MCLQLIEKMQHTGKWEFPPDVLQVTARQLMYPVCVAR
jgi:hypothetical protein